MCFAPAVLNFPSQLTKGVRENPGIYIYTSQVEEIPVAYTVIACNCLYVVCVNSSVMQLEKEDSNFVTCDYQNSV